MRLFNLVIFLFLMVNFSMAQITDPRAWAEWEETDGIIVHQPNFYVEDPAPIDSLIAEEWDSLYLDLFRGLFEEGVRIYYILDTNDRPEYHSGILDTIYTKYGIDIYNPDFHVVIGCKQNFGDLTKWTRDHGPMNIYKNGADTLYFFLFRDDAMGAGAILRDYLGQPDTVFYNPTSGNTSSDGGNYIVDGYSMGIINGGPGAVLPDVFEYFGLDTVYTLQDYLIHADYYLKMINEETLLLSGQDKDNYIYGTEPYTYEEDSAILSGLVGFFQDQVISQYGRPMQVIQVVNPPSMLDDSLRLWWYTHYASYTNSLIVNGSVFVPQFNVPERDSMAMEVYRQAMPGYRIIPVFSRRGATAGGGIHCLTNSVAASEPVVIRHTWYRDTVAPAPEYEVVVEIMTRSGVKIATVNWGTAPSGPFQALPMHHTDGNTFSASIPRQDGIDDLFYYISAESNSGKTGKKPLVAPGHTYHIRIKSGAPGWIDENRHCLGRIKIFPNPATELVTVDLSETRFSNRSSLYVNLYDLMGRKSISTMISPDEPALQIHLASLPNGQYFLVIMNENGDFHYARLIIANR